MPMPSMANSTHAPLAIFIYNRPAHTQRMIESLWTNPEFADSPVWIFCDGPKTPEQEMLIAKTRAVARELVPKHAVIVERDRNLGLAQSLNTGISQLCDEYGRVIVCEDDLFFSPLALGYLNHALALYKDEERVMHVSAYMFPVDGQLPQAFLLSRGDVLGLGDVGARLAAPFPAILTATTSQSHGRYRWAVGYRAAGSGDTTERAKTEPHGGPNGGIIPPWRESRSAYAPSSSKAGREGSRRSHDTQKL